MMWTAQSSGEIPLPLFPRVPSEHIAVKEPVICRDGKKETVSSLQKANLTAYEYLHPCI
jgi:hypothetical protein